VSPSCYEAVAGPAAATSAQPQCWQDDLKISNTLNNPGTDVEHDVSGQFSAADMQLLMNDVSADVASELKFLETSVFAGKAPASPYYVGGHFNLNLTAAQIGAFCLADQQAFASDFATNGPGDGVRQAATTGLAATLGYSLHSQVGKRDPGVQAGTFSFHFDRYSGTSFPIGTLGHFDYDVIGGHVGHPCLDPAWHH
jgi:hypothetical protein